MNEDQVASAVLALVAGSIKLASEMATVIVQNSAQGLSVVNTNLIHQHGGVGDDPGLIAALQTAAGAPKQGAWDGTNKA